MNLWGNQTLLSFLFIIWPFESSVNLWGNQTCGGDSRLESRFESSVNLWGNQTIFNAVKNDCGLRVV